MTYFDNTRDEQQPLSPTDPRYWRWWKDKLAGVQVPASEGTPYAGFYRWIHKSGYLGKKWAEPVAYWPGANGELNCRVGEVDVTAERGRDIWVNVLDTPVPEEWYREVCEHEPPKEQWRDGLPLRPSIGDNQPPPEFETLKTEIMELAAEADARLEGPPIADEAEASKIGTLADALSDLWKKADELRKAERKPHDEALKEIQKKWSPLLLAAEAYRNLKYKLLTAWAQKVKAEQKAEIEEAEAAGKPAPKPRKTTIATRGRTMALKPIKSAVITNFDEALNFFRQNDAIKAVVQDLANKAVRAGIAVPGVEVKEEEQVV